MTRRLLQVWTLLLVATLAAVAAGVLVVFVESDSDVAVVENTVRGGVLLAVAQVDAAPETERAATLARLTEQFGQPVSVLPPGPLPRPVTYAKHDGEAFMWAALASGERLRIGPLPDFDLPPMSRVIGALLSVLAVCGGLAVALTWPQLRTLRAFEVAATRLGAGDWGARVGTDVPEVARPVAQAFNRMAEELEAHIAARRRTLQVVSHELRTPVTRLQLGVDLFLHSHTDAERAGHAADLERDVDELDALVDELRELVRLDRPAPPTVRPLALDDVLHTIDADRRLDDRVAVTLPTLTPGAPPIHADRRKLERAVGNLLANALRHAHSRVEVSAARDEAGWWIDVDDDGDGVPEELGERVWEPFVRAGTDDRGTGLGLAIVRRIAVAHGGAVRQRRSPLGGASFGTFWPDAR